MKFLATPCRFALLCAAPRLSACGGGGGSSFTYPQNVSISFTPTIASLQIGATQQFTATVVNYTAIPTWNVQASVAPVGSITQAGLYTPPASPPAINYGGTAGNQGVVTVVATVGYPCSTQFLGCLATAGCHSDKHSLSRTSTTSCCCRARCSDRRGAARRPCSSRLC